MPTSQLGHARVIFLLLGDMFKPCARHSRAKALPSFSVSQALLRVPCGDGAALRLGRVL